MLIFVDSMSHYTNSFLGKKWDVVSANAGGATITQSLTSGRFGGGGITFVKNTSGNVDIPLYIQKNYDGVTTIICGLAVLQTATQLPEGGGGRLLTFVSGNTVQVGIKIMQSGQLRVIRSTAVGTGIITLSTEETILGDSVEAIASSSYDFLEVKITHHATTGSVEIKRNGSAFFTLTNVNTNIAGSGNSSSVCVGGFIAQLSAAGISQALQAIICDFHLLNTTVNGADPNDPVDFIGDRHWEVVLPTADSTPLEWTVNGSANHWENVDDINPPQTAVDNNTETVGQRDALLYQDLTGPASASVLLSFTIDSAKDTGGAVGVSGLMVSPAGGTQGNGTEFQVPNPVAFRQSFLCTDPAAPGTNPLTVAIVNASGCGYERTS